MEIESFEIERSITQDIQRATGKILRSFQPIRTKDGVYVYRCLYDGIPVIAKYFEKQDDRREILNYRYLAQLAVPTIQALALGDATLVMEDIAASDIWRLSACEDMANVGVAKCLAQWYFALHEKGAAVPQLDTLYYEYDSITEENLIQLIIKFPEARDSFQYILSRYAKVHDLLYSPDLTMTYNDFHWTNCVVRKDRQAAMMFDYNLLGRGYRYSDIRNVCSGLSESAADAFFAEYDRLYAAVYHRSSRDRMSAEKQIDDVAAPLYALMVAFEKESFPDWAQHEKNEAMNGTLLGKAKALLS